MKCWPPLSDLSGKDVYVQVSCHGPLRDVNTGGGKGSALTRYYNSLTGLFAPVAYWPCEEDPDTTIVGAGIDGGQDMNVTVGTPKWKAVAKFNGSAPVGVLNNSTWDGLTGSFGTSGNDIFSAPGTYRWVASTSTVDARAWGGGGGGAGANGDAGADGGSSSVIGDAVTVLAHGGHKGTSGAGGAGGSGSVNTAHHSGGTGYGTGAGAGGGGSSGGLSANGNNGTATAGGAAVTGGGKGGNPNVPGNPPGGGGGGGTQPGYFNGAGGGGGEEAQEATLAVTVGSTYTVTVGQGGQGGVGPGADGQPGGSGQVQLVYTPAAAPPINVLRFILRVQDHGGKNGVVVLRALTGGTVARCDIIYGTGGVIRLKGYNSAATLLFTSADLTIGDGVTVMVDLELKNSGTSTAYTLAAIKPGDAARLGQVTGTQATASIGSVTEVTVAPNADITKMAVGHISVQYALVALETVSDALNGHSGEMSVDRFLRLAREQAVDSVPEFSETVDHWGFETGTQGWGANNGTLTQSAVVLSQLVPWSFACSGNPANAAYFIATTTQAALVNVGDQFNDTANPGQVFTVTAISAPAFGFQNVTFRPMADTAVMTSADTVRQVLGAQGTWPVNGSHSLLLTASGAGNPNAFSPAGLSGIGCFPGDRLSVHGELYSPAARTKIYIGVKFFDSAGTGLTEYDGPDTAFNAGDVKTLKQVVTVPATAATFNLHFGSHVTDANGTLLYADNLRVHPRMGVQARKDLREFLDDIERLDRGILRELRHLHGLGYKTRIALMNQTPAVTLDYAAKQLAQVPQPVVDDMHVHNHLIVHRHLGGVVSRAQTSGPMSVSEPPGGVGRHKKHHHTVAEDDAQLVALIDHLLHLGTVADERYPVISVNLAAPGTAPIMSAVAGVEVGDFVKVTGLPFWFPNTTVKQLVVGYTEALGPYNWTLDFNCVPESPYEITTSPIAYRLW